MKNVPWQPCTVHHVKLILAKQLERQLRLLSGPKAAKKLGMPRTTILDRIAKPATFTTTEIDKLAPQFKLRIAVSLIDN